MCCDVILQSHITSSAQSLLSHNIYISSLPSAVARTSYLLMWIHQHHLYLILSSKSLHSAPLSLHPSKSLHSAQLPLDPSWSLQSAPLMLHLSWSLQSAPLMLHPSLSLHSAPLPLHSELLPPHSNRSPHSASHPLLVTTVHLTKMLSLSTVITQRLHLAMITRF